MERLSFNYDTLDIEIFIYEIKYYAFMLLKQIENGNIDKWKSVVSYAEDLEHLNLSEEQWFNEMKEQISLAQNINETINKIKSDEN